MEMPQILLNTGRILMGLVFLCSVFFDLKTQSDIFNLMREKRIVLPKFCFVGALILKSITSIAIILNFQTYRAALLLAFYIFIANILLNNFWKVEPSKRDFVVCFFLIHIAACAGLLAIAGSFSH